MTLRHFGDKKKDAQMADYEQAIVRLGLEKADAERELEAKRRELKSVGKSCDLLRSFFKRNLDHLSDDVKEDLQEKSSMLLDVDKKIEQEEKEIERLIGSRQALVSSVSSAEARLHDIEDEIKRAEALKVAAVGDANKLLSLKNAKERDAILASQDTSKARKELEGALAAVSEAQQVKVAIDVEVDASRRALEELNEIISVLTFTNKQGLDLTASFEGERKRLVEKERQLDAACHDLAIYAKRLQAEREKAGIRTPMVLPPVISR